MQFPLSISAELWTSMALFAFVTSVTPGPNNMMLLASGVNHGIRPTLPHMLGISCGHFVMLLAVGLGLGELFTQIPVVYTVMKIVGFAYMIYLAWGIAKSGPPESRDLEAIGAKPLSFLGAAAFQWVNPKAWVMALGYFSNYLPKDADVFLIAITSVLFSLINFPSISVWVLMGARMRPYFEVTLYRHIFNWSMALLLVASMTVSLLNA